MVADTASADVGVCPGSEYRRRYAGSFVFDDDRYFPSLYLYVDGPNADALFEAPS